MIEKTAAKSLRLWLGRSRPSFRKLKNDGVDLICPVAAMAAASELERSEIARRSRMEGDEKSGVCITGYISAWLSKETCLVKANLIDRK
jgi:hypothetical protein